MILSHGQRVVPPRRLLPLLRQKRFYQCQQRVHECERRYMITEEMAVYRKGYVQKAKEDAAFVAKAPAISYAPGV